MYFKRSSDCRQLKMSMSAVFLIMKTDWQQSKGEFNEY